MDELIRWNMYTCCTSDMYARHFAHLCIIKNNMDGSILTINIAISVLVSVSANDLNRTVKYGDLSITSFMQTANMSISLIGYMDKEGFYLVHRKYDDNIIYEAMLTAATMMSPRNLIFKALLNETFFHHCFK